MKNKFVFKKHLLMLTIICSLMVVALECFFAYFIFNLVEQSARPILSIVLFIIPLAILGLVVILFAQYMIVNDETVTFCKLFKRVQTINWNDATIANAVKYTNSGTQNVVTISDGTNVIEFYGISNDELAQLEDICKAAREKYNTDNLTI